MYKTEAIGKASKDAPLEKIMIGREGTSEDDVDVDIKYCGYCHTDIHLINNDWGFTTFPCVGGHEVAGVVTKIGAHVKDVKVGDHVGIGYFMDSCFECEYCKKDDEVNCLKGMTSTSCGFIQHGRVKSDHSGGQSYGGWSKKITAHRRFISIIPKSYPLEKAGPVFCGGITMFAPLFENGAFKGGLKVGIAGLGGLGQMGVLLAKAMGNHVTVISSSSRKIAMAKELGADDYIAQNDEAAMTAGVKTLDLIIDTIPASHDINPPLNLAKKKGIYVVVGVATEPFQVLAFKLIMDQVRITGSATGGMKITQECINFMAEKNIMVKTEMINTFDEMNIVTEKLIKGNDSGLRYVIDMEKIFC